MVTNTKALFISLLKALRADLVCDVGSRDGLQALLFRQVLPKADVVAFEANPINYEMMQRSPALAGSAIEMYPFAITNSNAVATFHITDVDYSNPIENRGTSSLLVHDGLKILKSVDVETRRLDDFVLARYPAAMKVGLWIDVEGVEYGVLEGITKISEKVVAIHVETANTPLRQNQRTFDQLLLLATSQGFTLCGSNITRDSNGGDVVFVRKEAAEKLGPRLLLCEARAWASYAARVDSIAVLTKTRFPALYRTLRRTYLKLCT